jgi:hypothetical protein
MTTATNANASASVVSLCVLVGETQYPTLRFFSGHMSEPFSVGTRADWIVSADAVAPIHFFVHFDGNRLYVAAASGAEPPSVDGRAIALHWSPLTEASELCFGAARIRIVLETLERKVGIAAPSLTSTLALEVAPRERGRLDRTLLIPPQRLATESLASTRVGGFNSALREVLRHEEGPAESRGVTATPETAPLVDLSAPPPFDPLTSTVFDGGTLRELAERLARASDALDGRAAGVHNPEFYARLRAMSSDQSAPGTPDVPPESASQRFALLRRLLIYVRRVPRLRLAVLGLVPVTLLLASFAFGAKDGTKGASVTKPVTSAPALRAPVAPPLARAATAVPASTASSQAPVPRDASVPIEPRGPAEATAPLGTDPSQARADNSGSQAVWQPAARVAFRAAYEGRLDEAARLYDSLASQGDPEIFRLAARLARAGAVRKP